MNFEVNFSQPVMEEGEGKKKTALEAMETRENAGLVAEVASKLQDYLEQLDRLAASRKNIEESESRGVPTEKLIANLEAESVKARGMLNEVLGSPVAKEGIEKLRQELREQNVKKLNQGAGGEDVFDTYFKEIDEVEDRLKG